MTNGSQIGCRFRQLANLETVPPGLKPALTWQPCSARLKAMPFQNMGRSLSSNGSRLAAVRAS